MTPEVYPDQFEVVNGPEDGTAFPITRTPVDIGSDPGCAVFLRFDKNVKAFHARVTVVSEGYRIRRKSNAPILVNGKRAGLVWSRIVRSGGIVRVGDTELVLQCAREGLASRSFGLPSESDLGWALRLLFRESMLALRAPRRILLAFLGRFFWLFVVAAIAVGALAYFRPGALQWTWFLIRSWGNWLLFRGSMLFHRLIGV